jgi:hypothetical protein
MHLGNLRNSVDNSFKINLEKILELEETKKFGLL